MQELQVFLEAEGALCNSLDWQGLQPLQGSFFDGATRLPKQLLGKWHAFDSCWLELEISPCFALPLNSMPAHLCEGSQKLVLNLNRDCLFRARPGNSYSFRVSSVHKGHRRLAEALQRDAAVCQK